ncbi:MAG TPA: hypothetical protein VGU64_01135, partial [Terriglobales bacterium]|nr:hypothetical protein [Terriglobales bacterium]
GAPIRLTSSRSTRSSRRPTTEFQARPERSAIGIASAPCIFQVLDVFLRKLTGGVEANLIEHPPKINQATNFRVATAQAGDVSHLGKVRFGATH